MTKTTESPSSATPTRLATPDVTTAQLGAIAAAVISQLVAWGVMSDSTGSMLVSIAGIVLPAAWAWADAHMRHGRAIGNASR